MNNVHEQCPNSDSETVLTPKLGWAHQVHTLNPGYAPTTHALRPGLCSYSACCVPAQATMCLFSLLCATIQPSLLCAFSAFYMPQYSRAYCPLGHNTLQCIATQKPSSQTLLSQYNQFYRDISSANSPLVTTQFLVL